MGELLPCPFCGGEGFVVEVDGTWIAGCNAGQERVGEDERCRESAISFHGPTREYAVAAWNRRAGGSAQQDDERAERERLATWLERMAKRAEKEGDIPNPGPEWDESVGEWLYSYEQSMARSKRDMYAPNFRRAAALLRSSETTQILRGALADIAFADDMTLKIARAMAKRIYESTAPEDEKE